MIDWRHSKLTYTNFHEKVVVRKLACSSNGILASDNLALDTRETENDLELKTQAEDRTL
jgi:hypothetical protein